MLETTETQAVSSGSAQTTTSNAMIHCLGELSTACKLVNSEVYHSQIQAGLHLTSLDIPAVCSPTHLVCSYHSLVPLADPEILFMLSVY